MITITVIHNTLHTRSTHTDMIFVVCMLGVLCRARALCAQCVACVVCVMLVA